jgi:hypothetical protein
MQTGSTRKTLLRSTLVAAFNSSAGARRRYGCVRGGGRSSRTRSSVALPSTKDSGAKPPAGHRGNRPPRGPGPCITPSTETCVVVVSLMASSLLSLRAACPRRADWRSRSRVRFTCARGCASSRRDRREGDVSERARSAIEREPAQLVAQPLVVEHKLPYLVGQLVALPLALSATSVVTLATVQANGATLSIRPTQRSALTPIATGAILVHPSPATSPLASSIAMATQPPALSRHAQRAR